MMLLWNWVSKRVAKFGYLDCLNLADVTVLFLEFSNPSAKAMKSTELCWMKKCDVAKKKTEHEKLMRFHSNPNQALLKWGHSLNRSPIDRNSIQGFCNDVSKVRILSKIKGGLPVLGWFVRWTGRVPLNQQFSSNSKVSAVCWRSYETWQQKRIVPANLCWIDHCKRRNIRRNWYRVLFLLPDVYHNQSG